MSFNKYEVVRFVGPQEYVKGLKHGAQGTILEVYDEDFYEVEFTNDDGTTKVLQSFPGKYLDYAHGG